MQKMECIYEEIAKRHGTSAEAVRRDIRHALKLGMNVPDPKVQGVWRNIPTCGKTPTPKEVIRFCSAECGRRLKKD